MCPYIIIFMNSNVCFSSCAPDIFVLQVEFSATSDVM